MDPAKRPWVVVHNLASLDGRLTIGPDVLLLHGDERWTATAGSGDPYARLLREYAPDAVLEGSGSFVLEGQAAEPHTEGPAEQPETYEHFLPERIVGRHGHRGWFAVVDGRGRVRWGFKEYPDPAWAGWHLLVLTCRRTPAAYLSYLRREEIPCLVAGIERVELARAFATMANRLGVQRILATGGGRIGGALLRSGLIDEVDLEFAPSLIGGDTTPSLFDGPPLGPHEWPTRLEISDIRLEHGHVLVRAIVAGNISRGSDDLVGSATGIRRRGALDGAAAEADIHS